MSGFIKKLRHREEKFALPHTHLNHVLIVSFLQIPGIPAHLGESSWVFTYLIGECLRAFNHIHLELRPCSAGGVLHRGGERYKWNGLNSAAGQPPA